MPQLPSHRNQSPDLQSKSIDRFLYDGNYELMLVTISVQYLSAKHEEISLVNTPISELIPFTIIIINSSFSNFFHFVSF